MRVFLFLIAIFSLSCPVMAQTYKVVATPATCPSNGTITINITNPPVGTITYMLIDPEGEETPAQVSNFFSGLGPGAYSARVYLGPAVIHDESVTILPQYVVNPPRITGHTIFPAYTCTGQPASNTGQIATNISNTEGSFPLHAYLYNGATYDGTNMLVSQVRIPSSQSYFSFASLLPGSYCILLTDTCGRSVIQNNMLVNSQNVSYSISVANTSTVQYVLKVDANCQHYLLDPLLNMNVNTTGFSVSSLQYSIEWPAGVFTEYKTYYDRTQLVLPLDYTIWVLL